MVREASLEELIDEVSDRLPAGWLTTARYASLHSVGSSTATRRPATG